MKPKSKSPKKMKLALKEPSTAVRPRVDPLAAVALGLVSKIPSLGLRRMPQVLDALHEVLEGSDTIARATRTRLQMHLIKISDKLITEPSHKSDDTDLLTTEQAAQLMGHSRPYVAMLIDSNKLKGASVSEGGHRRVPRSNVLAWVKKTNLKTKVVDTDYRTAASKAGMYDITEEQFVKITTKGKRGR